MTELPGQDRVQLISITELTTPMILHRNQRTPDHCLDRTIWMWKINLSPNSQPLERTHP
jgi:hypothetical protein